MTKGYFITGTDTDVGKTYASVKLIQKWKSQGLRVAAMKPVASGCDIQPDGHWRNADVESLVAASGQTDRALMNPYRFLPPIAPHIAARQAGTEIELDRVAAHYHQLASGHDVVLVEGAGGWYAPVSDRWLMVDMARTLELPVILVVGMRLGCLNHALLTAHAIRASGLPFAGWIANRIDPQMAAYDENFASLCQLLETPPMLAIPYGN